MINAAFQRILLPIFVGFVLLISAPLSAGPPEQSGPHVYRFEDYNWFWFSANGMIAFVGIDIPDFCNGGWINDLWKFQSVENPSDVDLWMDQAKLDDAMTFVYPASFALEDGEIDPDKLCWHVFEYGEMASGTTDAILTDNDAFAWAYNRSRKNSFHLSVHGVLYTPSEEAVLLNGGFHCVWNPDPNPDNVWAHCKDRLNLSD